MDWIVKGLIGLAILAAITAALTAINHAIGEHYIAPVRAEYSAKLASCRQDVTDAVKANQVMRTTLDQTVKVYNDAAAETKAKADDLAKRAADELAKEREKGRAAQAKIDRDRATAVGPPTPGDRAQQCDAADAILTDLAKDSR